MYDKELPTGERVSLDDGNQDSEYDSDSEEEEGNGSPEDQAEACHEDLHLERNAINFLSRSIRTPIRTRSGRAISLSHRALASYQ